jgi:hypothetical protein
MPALVMADLLQRLLVVSRRCLDLFLRRIWTGSGLGVDLFGRGCGTSILCLSGAPTWAGGGDERAEAKASRRFCMSISLSIGAMLYPERRVSNHDSDPLAGT